VLGGSTVCNEYTSKYEEGTSSSGGAFFLYRRNRSVNGET
jgi:hypothetical protein